MTSIIDKLVEKYSAEYGGGARIRAALLELDAIRSSQMSVLFITDAYESGVGHAYDNLPNPYKPATDGAVAYEIGKEFGRRRGIGNPARHSVGEGVAETFSDSKLYSFLRDSVHEAYTTLYKTAGHAEYNRMLDVIASRLKKEVESRFIPDATNLPDDQVDRILLGRVPGGSTVSAWFLPHATPKGLANVRDVVRIIIGENAKTKKVTR